MSWNAERQARLDQLRTREQAGLLAASEQTELGELIAALEADEARLLAPALTHLRAEQAMLRERLSALQNENEELAHLLSQQEQLAADARHWLAQFEQRHRSIQQTYTRLTGETLSTSTSA